MNSLVTFRANTAGHLSATPEMRRQAAEEVTATLRTRLLALQRRVQKAAQAAQQGGAKAEQAQAAKTDDAAASATLTEGQELDRDAFLRLLMTEMQNQDPLEPMDNSEMIAQLAQFTSLEQMNNLNESFESLASNMDQLNFISAQSLIGKYVEGYGMDEQIHSGVVDSVTLDGSIVVLSVEGHYIPMTGVLGITDAPPAETETPSETGDAPATEEPTTPEADDTSASGGSAS